MARKPSKPAPETEPLTISEIKFAQLYAAKTNATQCYIDAGLPCLTKDNVEMSRKDIGTKASGLLEKHGILEKVNEFRRDALEAAQITTDRVARTLGNFANQPKSAMFNKKGCILPMHKWPADLLACVAGFKKKEVTRLRRDPKTGRVKNDPKTKKAERETVVEYEVKFQNPIEAARILAQWLGMIGDREYDMTVLPPLIKVTYGPDTKQEDIEAQLKGDQFTEDDADLPPELRGVKPLLPIEGGEQ